jgi:hypothetical protein
LKKESVVRRPFTFAHLCLLLGVRDDGAEAVATVQGGDGGVGGGGDVPARHVDGVRHVVVHRELARRAVAIHVAYGKRKL